MTKAGWSFRPLAGISCNPSPIRRRPCRTCVRPLEGISCNGSYTADTLPPYVFPSPCGDKLQLLVATTTASRKSFPSPCGDKLQLQHRLRDNSTGRFPSPCGDKLQRQSCTRRSCHFLALYHKKNALCKGDKPLCPADPMQNALIYGANRSHAATQSCCRMCSSHLSYTTNSASSQTSG